MDSLSVFLLSLTAGLLIGYSVRGLMIGKNDELPPVLADWWYELQRLAPVLVRDAYQNYGKDGPACLAYVESELYAHFESIGISVSEERKKRIRQFINAAWFDAKWSIPPAPLEVTGIVESIRYNPPEVIPDHK